MSGLKVKRLRPGSGANENVESCGKRQERQEPAGDLQARRLRCIQDCSSVPELCAGAHWRRRLHSRRQVLVIFAGHARYADGCQASGEAYDAVCVSGCSKAPFESAGARQALADAFDLVMLQADADTGRLADQLRLCRQQSGGSCSFGLFEDDVPLAQRLAQAPVPRRHAGAARNADFGCIRCGRDYTALATLERLFQKVLEGQIESPVPGLPRLLLMCKSCRTGALAANAQGMVPAARTAGLGLR